LRLKISQSLKYCTAAQFEIRYSCL